MLQWDESLHLFTVAEYIQLPDGIELECIDGEKVVKGYNTDTIDPDVRSGYIAYGVRDPWNHELKDLFLLFKLKT